MDRMTSLRVFREVVEAGSFSAAADRLSLSAPMASKHVSDLEQSLGARLLHRSSRRLSLTEAGEVYYTQCRQALETLDAAESAISAHAAAPRGELKVSAPVWCANRHFVQALAGYHERYPQVMVNMRLANGKVDLVAEGLDLALLGTHEPSLTLIARPLCAVPFIAVASPAYLARVTAGLGQGEEPRMDALLPSHLNLDKLSVHEDTEGRLLTMPQVVMRSDDSTLLYHAALAGIGVAYLPEWQVSDDLALGRLVPSPQQPRMPAVTLFAVYMSRRFMPPKLRTFIDFLAESFHSTESEGPGYRLPAAATH